MNIQNTLTSLNLSKINKLIKPTQTALTAFAIGSIANVTTDTFVESPKARIFREYSKKIAEASCYEDFAIIAHEMQDLIDDTLKQELINKYVSRYESFYNELFANKNTKPQVLFNQIFEKDLSEEEAKSLENTYKEIIEEPDFYKFLSRLFVQAKKDFDLDYFDTKLELKCKEEKNKVGMTGSSSCFLDYIILNFFADDPLNRRKAFEIIMHELKHLKQNENAITVDPEKYIMALFFRNPLMEPKEIKQIIGEDKIKTILEKNENKRKDQKFYEQGLNYIKNIKNYFSFSKDFCPEVFLRYKKQLIEREAYEVSDLAGELFYSLNGNSI